MGLLEDDGIREADREDYRHTLLKMYQEAVGARILPAFFTPQEVASMLRVSRRSVYNWMRAGKLPASKVGDTWRVSQRQLDAFLEAGKPAGATPDEKPAGAPRSRKKGRRR